jgi:hypothetical protein
MVRMTIEYFSERIALTDDPNRVRHRFLLRQWCGIEEMLVDREAADTGIVE